MATTFKCQPTIDNPCLDANSIINGGGEIVQQIDGSVMVWINTTDGLVPYNEINTKPCCEYLGYIFDVENQKCLWEDISCDTCEMKIVINPNGDDGEFFFVSENSDCSLDISLDYIFKFDCDVLSSGNTINEEAITIEGEIADLTSKITTLQETLPALSAACEQYTAIYTAMCYTIRITNHLPISDSTGYYDSKTSKGDIKLPSTNITICCLSDDGLLRWQSILGDVKYNAWLNTNGCDTTIYTNAQANQLFTEGNALAENNNGINPYLLNTEDGLCDKQEAFLIAQEVCDEYQSVLDEINEITNQITELQTQLDVLAEDGLLCNDPISNLENFQAWFSLDVETEVPMLYETVYEEQIFGIGEGNLMQYILDNNPLTGIIISGETGVLPPFSVESTCDYDEICKSKRDTFIRELYLTQYLPLFGEPENSFENKELLDLMGGWYNSSWLNYSTLINDPDVIEKIKNKKIRISIKVNTCCLDFGILLDNIKVTQNCQILDNTAIKISKPIGFELDKFVDNKKSWVLNETPNRRTFYLDWRNTEYNINHGKLTINTKEIDLNIDPAKALEGDLFNYLNQNECLLSQSSSGFTTCGDNHIEIYSKLDFDLSDINTVEEFTTLIYSYLIDVKTRQSITAYPLLRLLYERYLTNNLCLSQSNGYNYFDMQNISDLVGNYWVDLIEQFVPATTIWGSTLVYRNTVFDTQKHPYKSNTLWLCEDPSPYFSFSAISNNCETEVIKIKLTSDTPPDSGSTPFDSTNFFSCEQHTYCDCVWTMTNYCNSEFIGRVIGDDEFDEYCETNLEISEVQLYMNKILVPGCNAYNQTWDSKNRVFTQILKISDNSFIPIQDEYEYNVISYGNNSSNITFNLTKLNTNTIRIDWNIPISAPEPIQTNCVGYFNEGGWDVMPMVIITEPSFNCEITRLFIYNNNNNINNQ